MGDFSPLIALLRHSVDTPPLWWTVGPQNNLSPSA